MMNRSINRKNCKFPVFKFVLLLVFIFGQSSEAQTSIYIFDPNQSTVVQTGGIAGINRTYAVEGQFQLTVDFDSGTASFDKVDANAVDDSQYRRTLDPNEVFAMTSLVGIVTGDTTLEFTGYSADGSNILLEMTIADDIITMEAQTTPPPNSADFFIFTMEAVAQRKYSGGTGEPNNPYLIYTPQQMNTIGTEPNDWDKHFKLMADINLSVYTGTEFNIIGYFIDYDDNEPFTGVFDGNGHIISNFTYASINKNYVGLFGYAGKYGKDVLFKDLGLIDPNINADTGYDVGSLVGMNNYGAISGCFVLGGTVRGVDNVGGLVGYNRGTVINCFSSCNVDGNSVGGLVGSNIFGTISMSYATGTVSGNSTVGGLVGQNGISGKAGPEGILYFGWIDHCYSLGSVTGNNSVGGFVGLNDAGVITECYSGGNVSGNEQIGGLIGGSSNYTLVTDCLWDVETSGSNFSAGGTGKTTAQMQDPNTFIDAGWDFVGESLNGPSDIWAEPVEGGYPILWWQLPIGFGLPEFSGGNGKSDNPYFISTAGDLNVIGDNPRLMDVHFKLINNIDLNGIDFYVIGSAVFPFKGIFDGNGHTISELKITGGEYLGLFGILASGAEVRDVGVVDVDITGSDDYAGGLVGKNDGIITRCYSTGTVSGDWYVGGLVGHNDKGITTQCYSSCVANGIGYIGGLVGGNEGVLINCYSTGSVSGATFLGGLVGRVERSSLSVSSYISNCFWDIECSGQTKSMGGTGKTTAEMKTESTFTDAGWDFVGETVNGTEDIWWIDEGHDYPHLWWELIEEQINDPNEN